jgi:hypothetical protein
MCWRFQSRFLIPERILSMGGLNRRFLSGIFRLDAQRSLVQQSDFTARHMNEFATFEVL